MSKKLGEMWKEVSSEEKDKYKVRQAYLQSFVRLGLPCTEDKFDTWHGRSWKP